MARLRTSVVSLLLVSLVVQMASAACEAPAPSAYINLSINGTGADSCILTFPPSGGFGLVTLQLHSIAVTKVRLSIPSPPGGTLLGGQWNYPATGNLTTGIEFNLGGCIADPVLGTLLVIMPQTAPDCLSWKVNDGAVVEDCDGLVLPAVSTSYRMSVAGGFCQLCCLECCQSLPAYNLSPPDGATGLSMNTQLSWDGTYSNDYGSVEGCYVEIGTNPDCATWTQYKPDCDAQTFAPGFLQPGTTYYWRMRWMPDVRCDAVTAPRSFTTAGPLAIEATTWGRVKAMYRD